MRSSIAISELFTSLQGEGLDLGAPSFFIRISGCSIGCKYCDTKYSWKKGKLWDIDSLVKEVLKSKIPEVIVTGGEPVEEKNLSILIKRLSDLETVRKITLETCGHIFRDDLKYPKLKIVLSPKPPTMGVDFPTETLEKFLTTYEQVYIKFAAYDQKDLEVIKEFAYKNKNLIRAPIVIQPLEVPFEDYSYTSKRIFELVISDRKFINDFEIKIIPQIHKLIGLK
ncbi:Radical SAM domain protein [Desulfurobacterium thermolithotrophum DSM 11699]|uniref:7-carboxy-7-deazaguanine synthase n=1 Tax=Desulfurobacterium thermolithotrophum (strain DSM 11699 / BSA) TaxID=868864 RepID=F0S1V3_DESTD|nr:7-carboxy-7-deazaguanine synthase QueE [Desulfurobacterium thermolithotrophum]ADY72958.1 Radical SAM domain protein [Desulfurobacterium thermolithotrophum DSM 11699]